MEPVTVTTSIRAEPEDIWAMWTEPGHIVHWNAASDDWCTTRAVNDLRVGGRFSSRMEARDGSEGFDFEGTYDEIVPLSLIRYRMDDGRAVVVHFERTPDGVLVTETFDPENENPVELQRQGWQAILERFRSYVESSG